MNYFAYATDLNKKQMAERCPGAKAVSHAVLPNYKMVFTGWTRQHHGAVATIKYVRGDRTRGAIYEVSDECVRRLDKLEGAGDISERTNVTVFDQDDEPVNAFTYVKKGLIEEGKPSPEYLAIIQQGIRDWRLF